MRNVGLKELYIQENMIGQAALANIKNAVSTRLIMNQITKIPKIEDSKSICNMYCLLCCFLE